MRTIGVVAVIAVTIGAAACETESPYFDSTIGSASAHLVQAQTLDPAAAGNPAVLAPSGADGQRIQNAVENYRKDVNKPEQPVSRPVAFEAGGPQGQ